MTGKAYTMHEMKQIVEYISDHRVYNEVKGRKMWMDFASSKMTNRTWQSLKETFLKRILPDITNPYYKLTMLQIASFREGQDVEKKLTNKLEVREADMETVSNGNTNSDGLSSSKKNTEGKDKGESHKNSKADRDSTETIVLNNCYETAEEIKRDLMTPDEELKDNTKTLRDLIEFEPMTPDVQQLIDDFVSEDEGSDGEPRMQIDLEDRVKIGNAEDEPIALSDTDETNIDNNKSEKVNKKYNISVNTDSNAQVEKVDSSSKEPEKDIPNATTTQPVKENSKSILNTSDSITSTHSTMPDSILPNNQEELDSTGKTNKKQLSLNKNENNLKLTIADETQDKKSPGKRKNNRINSVSSTNSDNRGQRNSSKKLKTADEVNMIVEVPAEQEVPKEVNQEDKNNQEDESAQSQNPCLQSVNLYNETIDDAKHSESDDTIKLVNQQPSTSKEADTTKPPLRTDVVVLKSHSSSSSYSEPDRRRYLIDSKRYKDHTLANVFGFKSGGVRRRNSNRRRTISQRTYDISSGSSDWTSESEEFVSPPRGRRNRHSKKYLKPKSSRVRSLEKNGGLFVVYNNRIYPLIKDSKVVKNYLDYASDDESDHDRKVWKRKYLEEKKRAEELERLLSRVQEKNRREERTSDVAACSSTCNIFAKTKGQHPPQDTNNKMEAKQEAESKPVKIKFTKNNEEVQLEGPLSHITPALAQVMQLLQKPEPDKPSPKSSVSDTAREITPSPIAISVEDVHEKVNKLESEIFKKIEEQDKIESLVKNDDRSSDSNVTKRSALRRRAESSSQASLRGAAKKPKVDKKEAQKKQETPETDGDAARKTRSSRTPRKLVNEISKTESNISKKSSKVKASEVTESTAIESQETNDDADIKYKFPSPPPAERNTQARNTRKSQKKSNSSKTDKTKSNISSSESLQSYQSEASPPKVIVKVKPGSPNLIQNQTDKFASIYMADETESSSSFPDVKQTLTFHNSMLSEVYKSDSYQLLMPLNTSKSNKHVKAKRDMSLARKINETHQNIENDGQSSSNISPPTSPVLSIVENLSISRSLLTSVDDLQTDEMDQLESHIVLNKLMESDDISPKPLMEQDCKFDSDHNDGINYHYNIQTANNTLTPTSQSLVKKLNTISLRDFNVSDTVYVRLEKLKLDSTKKDKKSNEEKENKAKVEEKKPDKAKTKKRSSTPRRKESTRKSKQSEEPTIEEEHVERNSCVSRNSCPAMLENTNDFTNDTNRTVTKPRTSKELKKLNIIKVKITKPKDKKDKTDKASSTSKIEMNSTQTSSQTENSIDLIHNHSETCLQAHECIDNSVEIVEKSSSVISVNSERSESASIFNIDDFLLEELYNTNARDGIEEIPETQISAECPDLFYTPLGPLSSANSLMTEDLTIDIPEKTPTPGKWFLVSEDEASTNFDLNQNLIPKDVGYGANLNDLFPVTCAVPDLSTITEMSKENDADTRSNLNISLPISKM